MAENPLSTISKIDPRLSENLELVDRLVFGDGAMPRKYRILIALAFDAAHGAVQGVTSLAERAIREGATKEEIADAIRVAYHLSGVGSVYTASRGLKELFP